MKQKDKTISSGSDASGGVGFAVPADTVGASASGDTTAPANAKATGRVKIHIKNRQAVAMIEAAIQSAVRQALGVEEVPDDTITPLAIPAPVPALPPDNVKDKSAVRATVGETDMADAEIRADGSAMPVPVVRHEGRAAGETRGLEAALNIHQPTDLYKLAEHLQIDGLEQQQDGEMASEPNNSIPPGNPTPGKGEYTYTAKNSGEDDMNKAIEPGNVPPTVPNYRPATGTKEKACRSCRFFETAEGASTGECTMYDFIARADYVCDSYQPVAQADPVKSAKAPLEGFGRAYDLFYIFETLMREWGFAKKPEVLKTDPDGDVLKVTMAGAPNQFPSNFKDQVRKALRRYNDNVEFDQNRRGWEVTVSRTPSSKNAPMRVGSDPASDIVGGEVVDDDFQAVSAGQAGIGTGIEFGYESTPELARSHGREKSIPLYLPTDRVYSKSLRTLGEVVKSEFIIGMHIYTIKLIDNFGGVHGTGVVQQSDLTPRSMRAIKRLRDANSSVKSEDAKMGIETQMKGLVDQIKTVCAQHGDLKAAPIPVARLQTIESTCKDILQSPDFQSVATDTSFRKYIRAVQDVQHAMSAATHLIDGARDNAMTEPDPTQKQLIWATGQQNALDRCKDALARAEGSLMDKVPMRTIHRRVFRDVNRE